MAGYTKLFSSIVTSTVWREAAHVKVVWITLLALADRTGMVESSIPGLADLARVTREQCDEALSVLSSPDPDSRTQDHDGRRIRSVDGGWMVLNHAKYRDKMSQDEKRRRNAAYMRDYRERKGSSKTTALPVSRVVHADAEAEEDPDQIPPQPPLQKSTARPVPTDGPAAPADVLPGTKYTKAFLEVWERTGRRGSKFKGWKAWTKAKSPPWSALCASWGAYLRSDAPARGFVQHLSTWLNARGWETDWPAAGAKGVRPADPSPGLPAPLPIPGDKRCFTHMENPKWRAKKPAEWCPDCREQVARAGTRTMTEDETLQPPDWMGVAKGGET